MQLENGTGKESVVGTGISPISDRKSALRENGRAAQRELEGAARENGKMTRGTEFFRKFRLASKDGRKNVAPLVTLARSAAGNVERMMSGSVHNIAHECQEARARFPEITENYRFGSIISMSSVGVTRSYESPGLWDRKSFPGIPQNSPSAAIVSTTLTPFCPKMSTFCLPGSDLSLGNGEPNWSFEELR
jgi:hypothetical protein